jgi:hypothetical protein
MGIKSMKVGEKAKFFISSKYGYKTKDGWEDPQVHNDPPEKRRQALQMGANIVSYAFSN